MSSAIFLPLAVGAALAAGVSFLIGPEGAAIVATALALVWLSLTFGHAGKAGTPVASADAVSAGWQALDGELGRSRRYGRPLVVVRVSPRGSAVAALAAQRLLLERRRLTDHAWMDGPDLYLVMPEADRSEALNMLARVGISAETDPAVLIRMAGFPADALSSGALVELLGGQPANAFPAFSSTDVPQRQVVAMPASPGESS